MKVRRHHRNDGAVMVKNETIYKQNKRMAKRLEIPFGKEREKDNGRNQTGSGDSGN